MVQMDEFERAVLENPPHLLVRLASLHERDQVPNRLDAEIAAQTIENDDETEKIKLNALESNKLKICMLCCTAFHKFRLL